MCSVKTWEDPKLSSLVDFEALYKEVVKAKAELSAACLSAKGAL